MQHMHQRDLKKNAGKPSVAYSSYGKPVERRKMHISGIRPVKPDRQTLNPTYPRRDKKNEGDFKDLLETEIKKMEPQKPSKAQ